MPFVTYWLQVSANRFQAEILNHWVSSRCSPCTVYLRLVATENDVTGLPFEVYRISGSPPTLPMMSILFIVMVNAPPTA